MTYPKSLEEFIEKWMSEYSPADGQLFNTLLYARKLSEATAAEILRVAEEWCEEPYGVDNCERQKRGDLFYAQGDECTADELYDFLKSYIQSVKNLNNKEKDNA